MNETIRLSWSSRIEDWDGYWQDIDYFEERWGEVECEGGTTSDGMIEEELRKLQEETQLVEPPDLVDWLIEKQQQGFCISNVIMQEDEVRKKCHVDFGIDPNASEEQKEKLRAVISSVDYEYKDEDVILDPSRTSLEVDEYSSLKRVAKQRGGDEN